MPPFLSTLLNRLWAVLGGVSIRIKVLGIVLGTVTLLGVFVTFQMRVLLADTLRQQLENQGVALAERLAERSAEFVAAGDARGLELFLTQEAIHYSSNAHNTHVLYAVAIDERGEMIADTLSGDLPGWLAAHLRPASGDTHQHTITALDAGADGPALDVSYYLPESGLTLHLGLAQESLLATVNTVTWQLVLTTLIMVAVGLMAAIFLTWVLTRPILELVAATHDVERGDFSRRVGRWAADEIGDLADAFNSMTAALAVADRERAGRERLRARYISGVIVAQEAERQRIARELHDSTSQSLTSILIGLRNLEETPQGALLKPQLDELRQIVDATLGEVHTIAWQLRPAVLDDLGLLPALERLAEDYQRRYGIPVDLVAKGLDRRLPVEMETALYRIVQEGLTNIARHAAASVASVLIDRQDGALQIVIEDDGRGFDPAAIGDGQNLGLQGIRERARLFEGSLTIESQPGQGTSLFVRLPLPVAGRPAAGEGEDADGG